MLEFQIKLGNSNFIVGKPKIQIRLFNKFSKKEFLDGFKMLAF